MNLDRQTDYLDALAERCGYLTPLVTGELPTGLCGATHKTTLRALSYLEGAGLVRRIERSGGAAPLVPSKMREWQLTPRGKQFISDAPNDVRGEPLDGTTGYIVSYRCSCGTRWTQQWSCACDDECPSCGRDIEASDYKLDGTATSRALDAYNMPTRRAGAQGSPALA